MHKNNRNINLTLPIQWFKIGEYYSPSKEFYRFKLKLPYGMATDHENEFIFHPKFGVIGIKGDEFAFLREDLFQIYFSRN